MCIRDRPIDARMGAQLACGFPLTGSSVAGTDSRTGVALLRRGAVEHVLRAYANARIVGGRCVATGEPQGV